MKQPRLFHPGPYIGLGASLMYFFDPRAGRRRRALARDQLFHFWRVTRILLSKASRDFNHRLHGMAVRTRSNFTKEIVPEQILVQRIRSKMGRVVSNPHAIGVTTNYGHVTLTGSILPSEFDPLLSSIFRVRGVTSVESQLVVQSKSKGVAGALQGPAQVIRKSKVPGLPRLIGDVTVAGLASFSLVCLVKKYYTSAVISGGLLGLFAKGWEAPATGFRRDRRKARSSYTEHPFTTMRMSSHH